MLIACELCGGEFDEDSAALLWGPDDGEGVVFYEPFLDDLRTSWPERAFHPLCYAREQGIDVVLDLIHVYETKNRGLACEAAKLRRELADLKGTTAI